MLENDGVWLLGKYTVKGGGERRRYAIFFFEMMALCIMLVLSSCEFV